MIRRTIDRRHGVFGTLIAAVLCGCHDPAPSRSSSDHGSAAVPQNIDNQVRRVETSNIRFEDVTALSGVDFTYRNSDESGEVAILENLGGGVAVFDFDHDGDLDLCLPGGGRYSEKGADPVRTLLGCSHVIYRNDGDWRFCDVTAATQSTEPRYYSHGAAAADFDNDGFCDVLITGYGGLSLLHSRGDGTFEEIADRCGMTDRRWSSSAAWGDFNRDGVLDVYIAHYLDWSFDKHPVCTAIKGGAREYCSPHVFQGLPDTLYVANGDGTVRDASRECGLPTDGKGLGVASADLDLDGDLDLYVANDTVGTFLLRNAGDGRFQESGLTSGTALNQNGIPDGSMGVDIGDYNRDGLPDIWVTNYEYESNALYRNEGNGVFQHVSQSVGVTTVGTSYVGWGTALCDFDHDGDEDAFVANGHVLRFPEDSTIAQQPLLFENRHGRRLINVASAVGDYFRASHSARGAAAGDLDNDGDLDLVVSHVNRPVALLSNTSEATAHSWLALRLIGVESPRLPIGAIVTLATPIGPLLRQLKGGGSYASTMDSRLHFGLAIAETARNIEIRWPSGRVQTIDSLRADAEWTDDAGKFKLFTGSHRQSRTRRGRKHQRLDHGGRTGIRFDFDNAGRGENGRPTGRIHDRDDVQVCGELAKEPRKEKDLTAAKVRGRQDERAFLHHQGRSK